MLAGIPGNTDCVQYHETWTPFSQWSLLPQSKLRTKFDERAFSYSGSDDWNSLPEYLQTTTDNNWTIASGQYF